MKLITYSKNAKQQVAFYVNEMLFDVNMINTTLPTTLKELLEDWSHYQPIAQNAYEQLLASTEGFTGIAYQDACIMAPIPNPTSCRDGYAFRQHVAAARRNRKVDMIAEFDSYPIFYFTNHNAIQGPGAIECMPDHFQKLDFELEIAAVIGKKGRNFTAAEADEYIAGYTIMNDMSARLLQMEEMKLKYFFIQQNNFPQTII